MEGIGDAVATSRRGRAGRMGRTSRRGRAGRTGLHRNWLLERGIYVHPHYMIREFLTDAHTEGGPGGGGDGIVPLGVPRQTVRRAVAGRRPRRVRSIRAPEAVRSADRSCPRSWRAGNATSRVAARHPRRWHRPRDPTPPLPVPGASAWQATTGRARPADRPPPGAPRRPCCLTAHAAPPLPWRRSGGAPRRPAGGYHPDPARLHPPDPHRGADTEHDT